MLLGGAQGQPWEQVSDCVWIQNRLLQVLSVMLSVISHQAYLLSYKAATQLALEVLSGLRSTNWLSRGGSDECSGKEWFRGIEELFCSEFGWLHLCLHLHMG